MLKSREFDKVLVELVDENNDDWSLERLNAALKRAVKQVADKQYRLRQDDFKYRMGGK